MRRLLGCELEVGETWTWKTHFIQDWEKIRMTLGLAVGEELKICERISGVGWRFVEYIVSYRMLIEKEVKG